MNVFLKAKSHNADGFSNIVALGDFVFVSGQLGQGKTFDEQCRSVFEKMEDLLACYNLTCRHIVKMTVYLSNLDNKGKFLDMFKERFEAPYPVYSIVEVNRLDEDALVMFDACAIDTLRYEKNLKESSCQGCKGC